MRILLFATLISLGQCEPAEAPGEEVGTYEFTGVLTEHTCGSFAIPSQSPLQIVAEIRADEDGIAYWLTTDGRQLTGSSISGEYRFRSSQTLPVIDPVPQQGYPGCALLREDEVILREDETKADDADGGVGDEEADGGVAIIGTFVGDNITSFSPIPGLDCRPALAISGGPFLELPCLVQYEMTGFRVE